MIIVFLSDDFPPVSFGGAGISTFELASGMVRAGHSVSVITTVRKDEDAGETTYEGITVYKIFSKYSYRWRFYKSINNHRVVTEVEKILENVRPDVVHANNIHFHISYKSLAVAKKYSNVVVWTARDTMSVCFGKLQTERYIRSLEYKTNWIDHVRAVKKRWNPFHNFFVRKYLNTVDARFSVSYALKDALEANGIDTVKAMHTGGSISHSNIETDDVEIFKDNNNLKRKRVLLFGGRLSEAKGATKSIEALKIIVGEIPSAVLLVVGQKDAYADSMIEYASKLGIKEHLLFSGWIAREKMNVAYAASDIVLVPSLYLDPFPRLVIEGMSAGKPVIGTKYGGAPEIILDGATGYIVDPFKPSEIAEKSIELLKNDSKIEAFGIAGKERVRSSFKKEDNVASYVVEYEALLNRKKT